MGFSNISLSISWLWLLRPKSWSPYKGCPNWGKISTTGGLWVLSQSLWYLRSQNVHFQWASKGTASTGLGATLKEFLKSTFREIQRVISTTPLPKYRWQISAVLMWFFWKSKIYLPTAYHTILILWLPSDLFSWSNTHTLTHTHKHTWMDRPCPQNTNCHLAQCSLLKIPMLRLYPR